jgi:hypothetical protein
MSARVLYHRRQNGTVSRILRVTVIEAGERGRAVQRHLEIARAEFAWVVESFPEEHALWSPSEDTWSAHLTLAHLRDTEREGFRERVRRVLEEDTPFLDDFPGGLWASRWRKTGPMTDTLAEYLEASRESDRRLAEIPDEAWLRTGTHPAFGTLTLVGWLERMHFHLVDHLGQILAIRAALRTHGLITDDLTPSPA